MAEGKEEHKWLCFYCRGVDITFNSLEVVGCSFESC